MVAGEFTRCWGGAKQHGKNAWESQGESNGGFTYARAVYPGTGKTKGANGERETGSGVTQWGVGVGGVGGTCGGNRLFLYVSPVRNSVFYAYGCTLY